MEKLPKTLESKRESKSSKKVFNLPGKQKVEWEFDPQTGEILSLAKKDAEGNMVEFYNLGKEELAQAYENYEKILAQPSELKRETPAEQSSEQKTVKNKTPNNWQQYGEIHNSRTNTTTDLFYDMTSQHFREVVKNDDTQALLRYLERDAQGNIINFENFDANARNPSDLQSQLDQAKKDHTYFEELENSGWKPTEQ